MIRRHLILFVLLLVMTVSTTHAQDEITYTSQPDEVAIFLNDVAFIQDNIILPAGTAVNLVLPPSSYADTIVLREGDRRVADYHIRREADHILVSWEIPMDEQPTREISITYLMRGISWTPRYDMWLSDDLVNFDFFVEINNTALRLNDVTARLIVGRVDTAQQIDDISRITTNQYIAGYESNTEATSSFSGNVTIQTVYDLGILSMEAGESYYRQMISTELPARRLLLWNAASDQQVDVIYKIRNNTDILLSEGIVRSYENGLFIGSDLIELTPIGSEGSVTVGNIQDVRVQRSVTRTGISGWHDTLYEITLSLANYSGETLTIDVVDRYPVDVIDFNFSLDAERQEGNLLRWVITLEPGEEVEINYSYKAEQ